MTPAHAEWPALTGEELLTTTRCVRRRLDLTRPVARELVEHCVDVALQAPTASYSQVARFICVDDPDRRAALGDIYRRGWKVYETSPMYVGGMPLPDPALRPLLERGLVSAEHLAEHMGEAPVLVIPCADLTSATGERLVQAGWTRDAVRPAIVDAALWWSVMPEGWSFMMAARSVGLASCWTCVHMFFEREAAEVLGVPYEHVVQAALIPVAHAVGAGFRPGPRMPASMAVHWNAW